MTDRNIDRMRRVVHALRDEIDSDPHRLSLQVLNKAILLLLENQLELTTRLARLEAALENQGSARKQIQLTTKDLGPQPQAIDDSDELELIEEEPEQPEVVNAIAEAIADELQRRDDFDESDSADRKPTRSVNLTPKPVSEDVIEELTQLDILDTNDSSSTEVETEKPQESLGSAAFPDVEPVAQIVAKVAIRAFDKRDNIFERGLELLKRWAEVDPKMPGTPFQMRPSQGFAYLNVLGLSAEKIKQREGFFKQQGYDLLLGRLTHENLNGDVWLYQK